MRTHALNSMPMFSTSTSSSCCERLLVPLNAMCSRKCAVLIGAVEGRGEERRGGVREPHRGEERVSGKRATRRGGCSRWLTRC
jgi:hypothetical protein